MKKIIFLTMVLVFGIHQKASAFDPATVTVVSGMGAGTIAAIVLGSLSTAGVLTVATVLLSHKVNMDEKMKYLRGLYESIRYHRPVPPVPMGLQQVAGNSPQATAIPPQSYANGFSGHPTGYVPTGLPASVAK